MGGISDGSAGDLIFALALYLQLNRRSGTGNSKMNRRLALSVFAALSGLLLSASVGMSEQKTAPSAPAPAAAPAEPSAPAEAPATAAPSGSSSGEVQFETAGQARSHCPGDTVVWANLASKTIHYYGERRYGATRRGAYMCEADAKSAGMKSKRNEKHP